MFETDRQYPNVPILEKANGVFELETYTVSMNRAGEPKSAVVIAKNNNSQRLFAINEDDTALMRSMINEEPIGKHIRIQYDSSTSKNRFRSYLKKNI